MRKETKKKMQKRTKKKVKSIAYLFHFFLFIGFTRNSFNFREANTFRSILAFHLLCQESFICKHDRNSLNSYS